MDAASAYLPNDVLPPTKKIDNLAVLPGAVWVAISGAVWGGHRGISDKFRRFALRTPL